MAVGQRAFWEPRTVLVTGAGPIGLLAALDRQAARARGPRPRPGRIRAQARTRARPGGDLPHAARVADIGFEPDVIVECTGVGQLIADAIQARRAGRGRVPHRRRERRPHGRTSDGRCRRPHMVLRNNVVVGSVNANKRHWYRAGQVLAQRGPRVAVASHHAARGARSSSRAPSQRQPDDIKVVVQFARREDLAVDADAPAAYFPTPAFEAARRSVSVRSNR